MTLRILGLDPSLTGFGLSIISSEDGISFEVEDTKLIKTKASDSFLYRYMAIRDTIQEYVAKTRPDFVAQEYSPFGESYSEGLFGLYLYTQEAVQNCHLDLVTFGPTQVKAMVRRILDLTGKMSKQEIRTAASRVYGLNKKPNHNIADALILAYMGWAFFAVKQGLVRLEDLSSDYLQSTVKDFPQDRFFAFSQPAHCAELVALKSRLSLV